MAKRKWTPSLHPRDRIGRFVSTGRAYGPPIFKGAATGAYFGALGGGFAGGDIGDRIGKRKDRKADKAAAEFDSIIMNPLNFGGREGSKFRRFKGTAPSTANARKGWNAGIKHGAGIGAVGGAVMGGALAGRRVYKKRNPKRVPASKSARGR